MRKKKRLGRMRMKARQLSKLIKCEKGSSLMYVLGAMLLLLAIGVSVLAAASANVGFTAKQRDHTRGVILADSVQRNILYSLQGDSNQEDSFSDQLLMALYLAHNKEDELSLSSENGLDDIPLEMIFSEGLELPSDMKVESIVLSFSDQNVDILESLDAILIEESEEGENGLEDLPRESRMAYVNAKLLVTVKVQVKESQMVSQGLYEFTGGVLSDDPDGEYSLYREEDFTEPLEMKIIDSGEWRLIRYEKVDL